MKKVTINVVNLGAGSISVGIDKGVELKTGKHQYVLAKPLADEVVRAASVLEEIEVQLVTQQEDLTPSTVDGTKKIAELTGQLSTLTGEHEALKVTSGEQVAANEALTLTNGELVIEVAALKAANAELTTKNEALTVELEELKAAPVSLASEESEPVAKTAAKRTSTKTEK